MVNEKDCKVLKQLDKDITQSYLNIADATQIGERSVRTAIDHLIDEKILKGYRADIDTQNLGYTETNVVTIETNKDSFDKLRVLLDFHSNIVSAYRVTHTNHLILVCKSKTNEGFKSDLEKIERTGLVTNVVSIRNVSILKEENNSADILPIGE